MDAKVETVHSKGVNAYTQPNYARPWFYSNNESKPLHIEPGGRRLTVHRIKGDKANCPKHFPPLWAEIKRPEVMIGAFKYFSTRVYEEANVMRAYETKAKQDMIIRSISHPIKFLIEALQEGKFSECIKDYEYVVASTEMQYEYKQYCSTDVRFHRSALTNAFKLKLGLAADKKRKINGKARRVFVFTATQVEHALRKYLKSPTYTLDLGSELSV